MPLTICDCVRMVEIIKTLGGVKAVADVTGASPSAVANWQMRRTIPWKHRPTIARVAAERGLDLPDGFWSEKAA